MKANKANKQLLEAVNLGLPVPDTDDAPPRSSQMAHLLYMAAYLPQLRVLDSPALLRILNECSEQSQRAPLHLMHGAQFAIPTFCSELLTGSQVVSLLVVGLWMLCGEDANAGHPLLASWPMLAEALVLAPKGGVAEAV